MMELFLVTTGQVFTWAGLQVPLAQLRQELAFPTLLVVTQDYQVLTQADSMVPSGSHLALIPCNSKVQDQRLPAWDSQPYPPGQSYHQPFDFESYEDFQGKFRRFPYIEKQLFQLQSTAYEVWARYETSDKHFQSTCLAIEKRSKACEILVHTSLLGFKTVKRKVKAMMQRIERLTELQDGSGVVRQISSRVQLKLLRMKTVVNLMKTQIVQTLKIAAKREPLLRKRIATLCENPCVGKGQQVLTAFLSVRDQYTQFRLAFEEVLDTHKDVPNRSQKASALLSLENTLPSLSQSLTPSHQLLKALELLTPALAKESETSRQTTQLVLHSVGLGVKMVKVKVEARLEKWGKVVGEMEEKRKLRQAVPGEFETEKRRELDRQQGEKEKYVALEAALRVKIGSEKVCRGAFLTGPGSLFPFSLLPRSLYPSIPHYSPPPNLSSEAYQATISRLQSDLRQKDIEVRELAYRLHQAKLLNENLRREGESCMLETAGTADIVSAEQRGLLKRYSSFV